MGGETETSNGADSSPPPPPPPPSPFDRPLHDIDATKAYPASDDIFTKLMDSEKADSAETDASVGLKKILAEDASYHRAASAEDEVTRMRRLLGQTALIQKNGEGKKKLVSVKLHRTAP